MTPDENKRRAEDEHVKYIKSRICNKDGNKSYVFISYKSDDWEIVLQDVVYRLVKNYGLNVYFDGSFDSHNSLWISQFPKNMKDHKCKGVLAFFDDKYATSYATLLELMYSQTRAANEIPVVPINLDKLTEIGGANGDSNTGLGVLSLKDGTKNPNAKAEEKLFINTFEEMIEKEILPRYYYNHYSEEKELTKRICSEIVGELVAYLKVNENPYRRGDSLEGIVDSIKDACGSDVFGDVVEQVQLPKVPITQKETIPFKNFVRKYNSKSFKGAALKTIKLIGKGEFAKYSSKQEYNSAFHLVWDFVSQMVAERGIQYIEMVNNCSVMDKNPVFITGDELAQRKTEGLESRYKKLDVNGFEDYYMLRNYDPYNWIALVLKKRMTELGLPLEEFCLEIEMSSDQGVEVLNENDAKLNDQPEVISKNDNRTNIGGISGPIGIKGNTPGTTVEIVEGKYSLVDFLKEYNNRTFQSKSCKRISLIGVDECEKYSAKGYETARKLVFDFAMKRIDESGMEYIQRVNGYHGEKATVNPIFITVEEHNERKARKESVSYTVVTSKAVSGYSMCTHYSEYDWLKNSLIKQLKALGLPVEKFYLVLEN